MCDPESSSCEVVLLKKPSAIGNYHLTICFRKMAELKAGKTDSYVLHVNVTYTKMFLGHFLREEVLI